MVFNSFSFIFIFFPVLFLLYYFVTPDRRRLLLCAASLVFYGFGVRSAPWQLGLLAGMTAFGMLGCALFRKRRRRRPWLLWLWVAVIAAPLVFVKLAGLFTANPPSLPLGLSFYTFQLIAFVVYAFRGGRPDALGVAAGTLMFPKLISGPIADPAQILETSRMPRRHLAMIDQGLQDFIIGLAYKVIIADHLAGVLGQIRTWGVRGVSVQLAWIGVLGYSLQLYFDFWGYSRMAIGVGRMLGMELPENFNHPYCSKTVGEFWRRWHITLGQWFKNYVYIPLGGSRNGFGRMVLSTLTVWVLTGIWHGAGWNYVCWGLMMFLFIMLERLIYGKLMSRTYVLGHIYIPVVIGLSWIFFITPDISEAVAYFQRLFGGATDGFMPNDWLDVLGWCWPYLSLGVVCCTPLPSMLWRRVSRRAVTWVALFALFWVCMYFMGTAASDPFLYFSF